MICIPAFLPGAATGVVLRTHTLKRDPHTLNYKVYVSDGHRRGSIDTQRGPKLF